MTSYTVTVHNPIIDREIMRIETDNLSLALSEAAYFSTRHGIAQVHDNSTDTAVARFRYGRQEIVSRAADDKE